MKRNSYDTAIKHLFRLGCEQIIPAYLIESIPKSCIHRWRNEQATKYIGIELNSISQSNLELLQNFANNKRAQRIFRAYTRLQISLTNVLFSGKHAQSKILKNKGYIVNAILRTKDTIPINKA